MALRDKLKKLTSFAEICNGRQKDLLAAHVEEPLTWNDFEITSLGKDSVPIVTFAEYPTSFFFGGQAFKDIIQELDKADISELRNTGVKIMLHKLPLKSDPKRSYTRIEVLDE